MRIYTGTVLFYFVQVEAEKVLFFSFVPGGTALVLTVDDAEGVEGLDEGALFDLDHVEVELYSLDELAVDLFDARGLLEVLDEAFDVNGLEGFVAQAI